MKTKQIDSGNKAILIHEAQHGNQAATAALIRQYTPLIRSLAKKYLKHIPDPEDAFGELQLETLGLIKKYDPTVVSETQCKDFGSYLKQYLRFYCIKRFERDKDRDLLSLDLPAENADDGSESTLADTLIDASPIAEDLILLNERNNELYHAIGQLPPLRQKIILYRYFKAMTPKSISKRLNIPIKKISNNLYKGLNDLRKLLDKNDIFNLKQCAVV